MERPLKMSSLESPATSSTEPTSWPSASTTFQPGSMTNQETGSPLLIGRPLRAKGERRSYHAPPEQPDGALRGDGVRIREHVEDLHLAGDPLLVAALEAARRHTGRHAVAEVLGAAKAQGRGAAVPRGIDGGKQHRPTLEVIGGVESHLRVDVAPVRRDFCETQVPLGAQRLLRPQLFRRRLLNALQVQRPFDAFVIEALEQAAERLGCDARPP